MSHIAFISYSSKDSEVATNVMHYLEDNDIKCWMAPRDIVAGAHYASAILEAIKSAKLFILIFSANSDSSEQVLKEVDRAVHNKLTIIPFRIESHMPSEAMEYYLCNTHWLNAYGVEIVEKYFDDLVRNCRDLLATKATTPAKVKIENVEDMPDRLKSIVNKMRDSAIREEKEGVEFHQRQLEEKKLFEEQQKRDAERLKLEKLNASLKKKKEGPEKTSEIKVKVEEKPEDRKKLSTKLVEFFILIIVIFAGWFLYSEYEKKNNQFETKVDLNEYVEEHTAKISYNQLKEEKYSRLQLESMPTSDLKLLAGEIRSKGGEMFERIGHDLVEKASNENEIHNLLLLNSLINQRYSEEKEIEAPSGKVMINPSEEGSLKLLEKQWLLASDIQHKALDFYNVYISLRKESPYEKDFILNKPDTNVLSLRFVENDEDVIDVLCSSEEMLTIAKQILSTAKGVTFYFKSSQNLKYSNEIQVNVNNKQNLTDSELSQVLVSLVFKLSNL